MAYGGSSSKPMIKPMMKPSSTTKRKLTDKEKKLLKEHHDKVPHTKSQKLRMVNAMSRSSKKYESKASINALHKQLFGK